MPEYSVEKLIDQLNLPPLPEPAEPDDAEARILVLFRKDTPNVTLTEPVSLADAEEYTSRDDTSDSESWFVGRNRPNGTAPGEEY